MDFGPLLADAGPIYLRNLTCKYVQWLQVFPGNECLDILHTRRLYIMLRFTAPQSIRQENVHTTEPNLSEILLTPDCCDTIVYCNNLDNFV